MKFKLFLPATADDACPELVIRGLGSLEEMAPGCVNRPNGTGDWLLMFFYPAVEMEFRGEKRRFPPRTLRLWRRGAGHIYGNSEQRWLHSWIHVDGTGVAAMLAEAGLEEDFVLHGGNGADFEAELERIWCELTRDAPHPGILRNHFHTLLLEVGRLQRRGAAPAVPEVWRELYDCIRNGPEKALDLNWMARKCNRSVPVVVAEFRRYFGISPIRFQLDCRTELARYLLRDHNLAIKEIAQRCGYRDAFQFSRMFRRRTGVSPRDFRDGKQGGEKWGERTNGRTV